MNIETGVPDPDAGTGVNPVPATYGTDLSLTLSSPYTLKDRVSN
jgi:hypothetical protein